MHFYWLKKILVSCTKRAERGPRFVERFRSLSERDPLEDYLRATSQLANETVHDFVDRYRRLVRGLSDGNFTEYGLRRAWMRGLRRNTVKHFTIENAGDTFDETLQAMERGEITACEMGELSRPAMRRLGLLLGVAEVEERSGRPPTQRQVANCDWQNAHAW